MTALTMALVTPTAPPNPDSHLDDDVRLIDEIRDFWRQFFVAAFNPYRPERHYMTRPRTGLARKHGGNAEPHE
ncbi:MAG: hypothetical protein MZV49_10180 [Rhodopseudomonas palustris]|nr:hypothetical protein [Rhodopseudomonas palustris]